MLTTSQMIEATKIKINGNTGRVTLEDIILFSGINGGNEVYINQRKNAIALRLVNDWRPTKPLEEQIESLINFIYKILCE